MSDEEVILLDRSRCPMCHEELELVGLMDESVWDGMRVDERVAICIQAGIDGKHGSKSYSQLQKLPDEEVMAICDYRCPSCGTDWPIRDLLEVTTTPLQVEVYMRQHQGEDGV